MNSALETENGYTYTAGLLVAVMPQGGMSSESTHCDNFSSIGASKKLSISKDEYLVAEIGNAEVTVKMPTSMSAYVIILGDSSPDVKKETSTSQALDENGVYWS